MPHGSVRCVIGIYKGLGMRDFIEEPVPNESWSFTSTQSDTNERQGKGIYLASKRIFDIAVSCAALPVFFVLSAIFLVLNKFWNPGPLFFLQERMGKDQRKFSMIKFRTMLPEEHRVKRGPFDELEEWRITPFGRWMRKTRLDEVPQILNVITGEMSLIGPRPEMYEFAKTYHEKMPGYEMRGSVRPGITGFSQVKQGYTDSEEMVRRKTNLDNYYIRDMCWYLDLKILFWTVCVVLTLKGAK